tara:strand:- start:131 stop:607 length:477 start_codon:yes stop_codon:yes gene_type:complete
MAHWYTGKGERIRFDEIISQIKEHSMDNGTTYIGTDSFFKKQDCVFSTAICLYGANKQRGGRYFFRKNKVPKKNFPNLFVRMLKEAEKTIKLGQKIVDICNITSLRIELHLDISDADAGEGTSNLTNMLVGYVKGSGFDCKIKPDAFAAASIADKHSK